MLKRQRCDTNEGSETGVTVTSELHARALVYCREKRVMMMMMFIAIPARDSSSKERRRIWAFGRRSGAA